MPQISPETKLLSVREFAQRQGWSEWVVRYRVRMFDFPHVRQGKRLLIPENAAELEYRRQQEEQERTGTRSVTTWR